MQTISQHSIGQHGAGLDFFIPHLRILTPARHNRLRMSSQAKLAELARHNEAPQFVRGACGGPTPRSHGQAGQTQ